MENLRSIEIKLDLPSIRRGSKGYFHGWVAEPFSSGPYDHSLSKTFALIELPDGCIRLLEPETIRFLEPISDPPEAQAI
jgi:hypothetical protein